MKFAAALIEGRLIRRYKRFLADVELARGGTITAVCPNTGSLMGCVDAGNRVWLSESNSPTRKYRHTWEMVEAGVVSELAGYRTIRAEVPFGEERSHIDLVLEGPRRKACSVEVKNVTAAVSGGVALFPDSVSERGAKHLRELMRVKARGLRPIQFYCVQRGDVNEVRPADAIDPVYGRTLREAIAAGVEVLAYRAMVTPHSIALVERIPVRCP